MTENVVGNNVSGVGRIPLVANLGWSMFGVPRAKEDSGDAWDVFVRIGPRRNAQLWASVGRSFAALRPKAVDQRRIQIVERGAPRGLLVERRV